MRIFSDGSARGDILPNHLIELIKVKLSFIFKGDSQDAAADIRADHRRNDPFPETDGRTDHPRAGVNVGHDADLRTRRRGAVTESLQLSAYRCVNIVGINEGACVRALNFNHNRFLSSALRRIGQRRVYCNSIISWIPKVSRVKFRTGQQRLFFDEINGNLAANRRGWLPPYRSLLRLRILTGGGSLPKDSPPESFFFPLYHAKFPRTVRFA